MFHTTKIIIPCLFSKSQDRLVEKLRSNKSLIEKIDKLLDEIENNPTIGTGKPERLKGYNERCVYSRRIDKKHRLTYEIFEDEMRIKILVCYGHYDDK